MQAPQPMQRSWSISMTSPAPLLQNFTGQTWMQAWQLMHFAGSMSMRGGSFSRFLAMFGLMGVSGEGLEKGVQAFGRAAEGTPETPPPGFSSAERAVALTPKIMS